MPTLWQRELATIFTPIARNALAVGVASVVLVPASCDDTHASAPRAEPNHVSPDRQVASSTPPKTPAEIEALWDRRDAEINEPDAKRRYALACSAFQEVLRRECTQADRDTLLDFAANAPDASRGEFAHWAVAGLVALYAAEGDRASLVQVLARACPDWVGLRHVEDYIVLSSRGIDDPVTILFDAFEASNSPDAKKVLADGLRRGFSFAGNLPADDAELVAWCKGWYQQHRDTYVANSDYSWNSNRPSMGDPYQQNGLFVPKSR